MQRNLVTFSVKDRRFVWDENSIELQMIPEGVVELLTKMLKQLPDDVIQALKVRSSSCQDVRRYDLTILLKLKQHFSPNNTIA